MAGIDGPHNYNDAVNMSQTIQQKNTSDGPKPAGSMREEQTASPVPDAAMFANAHGQARSGDPYRPTMPGHLGNNPMFPAPGPISYDPGSPTMVTHVSGDMCAAYGWPDAPGGGLGNHPDGYES